MADVLLEAAAGDVVAIEAVAGAVGVPLLDPAVAEAEPDPI